MTDDARSLAAESWAFALKLYAEPGVSEACLTLQARANVDVMLLLVAVFAVSQRQIRLSIADINSMDDATRPWREQVVHPLRTLRTMLKSGPAPAPSEAAETLRSQIKANELAAERLENDLLAAWLQLKSPEHTGLTSADILDVVRGVVGLALGDEPDGLIDDVLPAINVISEAADGRRGPTSAQILPVTI